MNLDYDFTCHTFELSEILLKFQKHGIVHVPNFITKDAITKLNIEFENILINPSKAILSQSGHPMNPDGRTARLSPWHKDALNDFPEITKLFRNDFLKKIAEAYFAPHEIDFNDEVFATHEKPAETPILPWHFDRMQSIKFWFYLTDTTRENGAFEYCPNTHWEGHYRAGFHLSQGCGVEDIPNDIDESLIRNPVSLELKAGDLLIFDSDGFHRGGIVQPDQERRVLRGHTHPKNLRRYSDKPLSAGWWLKSFLNLNKWTGNASKRILGDQVQDHTLNRKKYKS